MKGIPKTQFDKPLYMTRPAKTPTETMTVSSCCGADPTELCNEDTGFCPDCRDHTEFIDVCVECNEQECVCPESTWKCKYCGSSKPIPMYFAETREGHLKTLPFNCGLRKARKIAQELANDWEATVHLTVRVGYGASKYVSGQALYYPELSHNRWCSCVDCTGGTL